MVDSLVKGVARFHRSYFRKNRSKFVELVREGQNPDTLFITCADSRIIPHALTQSDPGDLFVMRNVGNMVPAHRPGQECSSTGAGIEYAVSVLGVSEIVVCGHSHCGACAALYQTEHPDELALTRKWLAQGSRVRDLVLAQRAHGVPSARPRFGGRVEREHMMRATEKAMVVQHLANLMTYPAVARRVADGSLTLHGWYYVIERGVVEAYDPEQLAFAPVVRRSLPARPRTTALLAAS
ncbi:carbonic anhydrase [Aromatoleum toluclasticum]|uniref:carbonic anhydrase n=1 Tax=Aromatoleum toluclasticum TaxID=92003 RepID=UPI001D18162F|nr:carbonic anhydrase [Aromatoleum toluclasticum]MCC4116774.1 carbonic anhydrase [Aromatoleum toluclasticum]